MNVFAIVDWLSFSLPSDPDDFARLPARKAVEKQLANEMPGLYAFFVGAQEWERNGGRAPYSLSYRLNPSGTMIYAHPNLPHLLVELSGVSCEHFRKHWLLDLVIESFANDVTRIDIAVDIETDVTPEEFIQAGYDGRFKTTASVDSPSGQTRYIGSQKSDRFVRVYRYSGNHPRAGYLRIEFVFRRGYAKSIANAILRSNITAVAQGQVLDYGFNAMKGIEIANKPYIIENWQPKRTEDKTELWMKGQVLSAMKNLCERGAIKDPVLWLEAHWFPELYAYSAHLQNMNNY